MVDCDGRGVNRSDEKRALVQRGADAIAIARVDEMGGAARRLRAPRAGDDRDSTKQDFLILCRVRINGQRVRSPIIKHNLDAIRHLAFLKRVAYVPDRPAQLDPFQRLCLVLFGLAQRHVVPAQLEPASAPSLVLENGQGQREDEERRGLSLSLGFIPEYSK